jgi:TPR repeat protein
MKLRTACLLIVCLSASAGFTAPVLAQDTLQSLAHDQPKFDRGTAAFDAGDYDTAYNIFQELADDDDIAAMRNVALMKRKGLGTERDPDGAREYLERAAQGGLPTAQYDLAEMMLDGEGGPADPKGALPWLASAAAAHHPLAEFRLGELYEEGTVVPQDLVKAESLYAEAAGRGVEEAGARLSALEAAKAKSDAAEQPRSP